LILECEKIFIVEDDCEIRELLRTALEDKGYGVESFSTGERALERLRHVPEPCLILLDLMMPVMNGIDFMREFLKLPSTIVPIPVYLCSASASASQAKSIKCDGFIKKPVDMEALFLIVGNHCETRTVQQRDLWIGLIPNKSSSDPNPKQT
jgi:CheY-like chemotaxis protein